MWGIFQTTVIRRSLVAFISLISLSLPLCLSFSQVSVVFCVPFVNHSMGMYIQITIDIQLIVIRYTFNHLYTHFDELSWSFHCYFGRFFFFILSSVIVFYPPFLLIFIILFSSFFPPLSCEKIIVQI